MTTIRKLLLAALAAASLIAQGSASAADPLPRGDPERHGFSTAGLERIDRFFADEIARDRIPGAVVAIARQGRLVYFKAHGFQDKEAGIPMRSDTIFQIASMTKPLTVVAALTLNEEGRLPLMSPLSAYYPQFASVQVGLVDANGQVRTEPARRPITVHDLMRHTSGITSGGRGSTPIHKMWPATSTSVALRQTGEEFMAAIAKLPLLHQPGTTWDYSLSTDVLGMVVEKLTGQTLGEVLMQRVWSKVRMPDTSFSALARLPGRIARPLPVNPLTGKPQRIMMLSAPAKFECGGVCAFSTAGDYVRFGQMLLNGGVLDGQRVLSPATVEFMSADHLGAHIRNNVAEVEPYREGYSFGLGVSVRTQRGVAATNGSVGDYSWNGANGTIWWNDPRERLVVVAMTAAPGAIRWYYREQMAALVYGAMDKRLAAPDAR